jgi:hypothetical protein
LTDYENPEECCVNIPMSDGTPLKVLIYGGVWSGTSIGAEGRK